MNTWARAIGWTALVAATAAGAVGLLWRMRSGFFDTGLNNHVVWGLWVSAYIYFLGMSAGAFVLSSLVYVFGMKQFERVGRLAVLQAFVCMLVGVIFVWVDLGKPMRFHQVLIHANSTSLLAWEAYVYLAYLMILMVELYLLRKPRSQMTRRGQRLLKVLAAVGIPVAIGVHWGTGALFGVIKARPSWNTGITPVAFLASALVSGIALLMLLNAIFGKKDEHYLPTMRGLGRLAGCLIAFDLLLLLSEALVTWYGFIPHHVAAFRHMYFGPFAYVFWVYQVVLGAALPLLLLYSGGRLWAFWAGKAGVAAVLAVVLATGGVWLPASVPLALALLALIVAGSGERRATELASVMMVVGVMGFRLNIVIPPQIVSPFAELASSYYHLRNTLSYFPQLMEWLVMVGVVAVGAWIFILGVRIIKPVEETEPAQAAP